MLHFQQICSLTSVSSSRRSSQRSHVLNTSCLHSGLLHSWMGCSASVIIWYARLSGVYAQACGVLAEGAAPVGHLDGDTAISAGTFGAALAAAGAVCRAVDRVVAGEVRSGSALCSRGLGSGICNP